MVSADRQIVDHRCTSEQPGPLHRDRRSTGERIRLVLAVGQRQLGRRTARPGSVRSPGRDPGCPAAPPPAAGRAARPDGRPSTTPRGAAATSRSGPAGVDLVGTNSGAAMALTVPAGLRPAKLGRRLSDVRSAPWRSRPNTSASISAIHDASMTFGDTPMVVHVSSPSVESISTRVTAPVSAVESSTRTLKSVRWMRSRRRVVRTRAPLAARRRAR